MTTTTTPHNALDELQERLGGIILRDAEARDQRRSDYGGYVDRLPGAVARCATAEQVAEVVRHCRRHGITVTARGQAHSQSGQSTSDGGVVIDTSTLNEIFEVDEEGLTVTVGSGLIWRDLVAALVSRNLVPRVLTNNLGVSIGGTVSMAGLGVASFRYGAQVDNVEELQVVTGTGEVVVCSAEENRDLFDVARSGLSQFGIITRAKLRLRRCKSKVRKYFLLYDDLGALMRDSKKVMEPANDTFHSLESWCSPCPQGAKKVGEGMELGSGMQVFAYWMFPLHLTVEYEEGEEPNDDQVLADLDPYRCLEISDFTQHEFCERLQPIFQLWDRSGYSDMAHPWMETILPWDRAQEYIEFVLSNLPPQTLGPGGHILLWPSRGDTSEAPLFITPGNEEFVMGWGILPGVPRKFLDLALAQLEMASEMSIGYGGKRYLSGYITFDTAEKWQAHFGDQWPRMLAAKKKYDPDGILNPGFIRYE